MKVLMVLLCFIAVRGAPRSKSNLPQTVYDQKQKGDYNIQVHLKDFQIIALLGDDALGDYDYDYDYSDLTIKPPTGNVTLKPPTTAPASTPPPSPKPETSSPKPENLTTSTTSPPRGTNSTDKNPSSTTTNSPDRIKVQIIQDVTPTVNIVPGEELTSSNRAPSLGEILQYKRCATGYTRDKKGRCRRLRRPGVPFDLGRLASNLAARLKQSSSSAESSSESQ